MRHNPRIPSDAEDRFIETILHEAYGSDSAADQRRVTELMNRIRREDSEASVTSIPLVRRPRYERLRSWTRLAIAACLLIACGYGFFSIVGANTAYATVVRALHVTFPAREYRVQMVNRWPVVGEREVTATLFVNNRDEFCLQHPGLLPGGELWLGGDLESRWIVPSVGPVITGNEDLFASALQQQGLGSKMLHMQTLLLRMSEEYELELLADERLTTVRENIKPVLCEHVVGVRRSTEGRLPAKIELWANKASGVAERIVLDWPSNIESWLPMRWQIDLVAFPELADDWFEFQGHREPGRARLPFEPQTVSDKIQY
jgi:hypothetical protein